MRCNLNLIWIKKHRLQSPEQNREKSLTKKIWNKTKSSSSLYFKEKQKIIIWSWLRTCTVKCIEHQIRLPLITAQLRKKKFLHEIIVFFLLSLVLHLPFLVFVVSEKEKKWRGELSAAEKKKKTKKSNWIKQKKKYIYFSAFCSQAEHASTQQEKLILVFFSFVQKTNPYNLLIHRMCAESKLRLRTTTKKAPNCFVIIWTNFFFFQIKD